MKFTYIKVTFFLVISILLTGCLYPQNERVQNRIPYEDQLEMVQSAIERYSETTNGLMPIKTSTTGTPLYEKHLIDFGALMEKNAISTVPGNAFENGGSYQYVIMTPEDNPRVKLIDLRTAEILRKVNVKLDIYRSKKTYPPFGKEVEKGIFYIDYKKIGFNNDQYVVSPFSQKNLPLLMDIQGNLYIDYRIDLKHALETYEHDFVEGDDIRSLLPDNAPFVPAYSLPYTLSKGDPVFLFNEE